MVGLPGKSKGCTTCRRRKIKCDQGKPFCQRCLSSKRSCEGYDRYPIFVNRTVQGLEKRVRLAEAKPSTTVLPQSDTSFRQIEGSDRGAIITQSISIGLEIYQVQFTSIFWDACSSGFSIETEDTKNHWLWRALAMPNPQDALRLALMALTMTRTAWIHDDERLRIQGKRFYGLALKQLQIALWDPVLMLNEETLAAARTLVSYEVFESTENSLTAWAQHITGLTTLLQFRGPHRYSTPLAQAVLDDLRYPLMVKSLATRQSSFLTRANWRTDRRGYFNDDTRRDLFNIGLLVAGVYEQIDIHLKPLGSDWEVHASKLLIECERLSQALDDVYAYFEKQSSIPPSRSDIPPTGQTPNKTSTVVIETHAHSLQTAITIMHVCGIKLALGNAVTPICNAIQQSTNLEDRLQHVQVKLLQTFSEDARLAIARRIVTLANFCMQGELGLLGPMKMLFPMMWTLSELRTQQADDLQEVQETFREFWKVKGIALGTTASNPNKKHTLMR